MCTKCEVKKEHEEETEIIICDHCGRELEDESDLVATTHDNLEICQVCLDDQFFTCEHDGNVYPIDESTIIFEINRGRRSEHGFVHTSNLDHYSQCEDCQEYFTNDSTNVDENGHCLCDACYQNWFTCDACYSHEHSDNGIYVESENERLCDSCGGNYYYCDSCEEYHHEANGCPENCSHLIKQYTYKPSPIFNGTPSLKEPYIGLELEIEAKNSNLNDLAEKASELENCYLKKDGSLDNGFEIVSHPSTLEHHKSLGYEAIFNELSNMGARSHDTKTCGLHFHLDKSKMSDSHKVRFGLFFAYCKHELELLARRSSERWSKFKELDLEYSEYSQSSERYEAVNWLNEHTVEVRIFKGTLKYSTFMASMELCHAIYNFTLNKQALSSDKKSYFKKFIRYVKKNDKKYSYLITYLKQKTFIVEHSENSISA